jgi:hypothetical protein
MSFLYLKLSASCYNYVLFCVVLVVFSVVPKMDGKFVCRAKGKPPHHVVEVEVELDVSCKYHHNHGVIRKRCSYLLVKHFYFISRL